MNEIEVSEQARELVNRLSRAAMGNMFVSGTTNFECAEEAMLNYIRAKEMRIAEHEAEMNKLKAQLKEQPTTNCSRLENDFTARKTKWGSWSGDIWEVNNKHGQLVGHITEFGFKLYDQPVWGTPTELRQLADLVEATLKGNE